MWYHPAAFALGKRDVIGAWLLCLVTVIGVFGYGLPAIERREANFTTAATAPNPTACHLAAKLTDQKHG
jgi:hypothetical protein